MRSCDSRELLARAASGKEIGRGYHDEKKLRSVFLFAFGSDDAALTMKMTILFCKRDSRATYSDTLYMNLSIDISAAHQLQRSCSSSARLQHVQLSSNL